MIHCTRSFTNGSSRRRGTIVSLMAILMVTLIGFLGLAIDLGMLSIAKTQAQNAADLAALTAARTLNGNPTGTYNNAAATTNAQNILSYNQILGQSIAKTQLALSYGSYDYSQSAQTFSASFPATSGVPYTAVAATITASSVPSVFSQVFGAKVFPSISATAQAVHRPRDVGLVMDLSGSMRFGSCTGFDFYASSRTTNNPDSAIPTFGHYSSNSAGLKGSSSNSTSAVDSYTISPSNITAGNSSYTRTYVNNFYSNAAYAGTLIRAFDSYTSTDGGNNWSAPSAAAKPQLPAGYTATPGGDRFLYNKGSVTTYAQQVEDAVSSVGSTARNAWWELDGYSGTTNGGFNNADLGTSTYASGVSAGGQSVAGAFSGYTQGPGYYGKTFFVWPPDPRQPLSTSGSTWTLAGGISGSGDYTQLNQFLLDFGYTAADFNSTSVSRQLTSAMTNAQTTLTTSNGGVAFPSAPFRVIIDSEIMSVTAIAGNNLTVTRHVDGTTAAAHSNGAPVKLATGPPLCGIFAVTTTTSSQTWPWPNDSGATLGTYLTTNVYKPGSASKLLSTDAIYQKIMRLYNWNYVVDNYNAAGSGANFPGTTPCDWRLRFFGTVDNTVLFNASGSLNAPGSAGMCSAITTYNEILRWIKNDPNPFPTQLRAGRVKYYSAIPSSISGSFPNWGGTDQRFWVEFINYVLGYYQTASSTYQDISAMAGYGSDFTWGTLQRSSPPGSTQYMNYSDNPARGKLRHWFGPLAMVDYMQNYNMDLNVAAYFQIQPGDTYEAPLYTGKEGFQAAISTMQNNHPNDWFTLALYSSPRGSVGDTYGRFNGVACPLGTNYNYASSALYFPFSTIKADGSANNTEVTPYDADAATGAIPSINFQDTPRANGNTCFSMGLMLCYNQFAVAPSSDTTLRTFTTNSPITFPTGMAGGSGRKGAQKIIIFETDGLPNASAIATLTSTGTYSYYKIRYDMNKPNSSEYPAVTLSYINDPVVLTEIYGLVDQLKNDYGTTRNPFRLYTLGFGPVFTGTDSAAAQSTLQAMQYHAGTQANAATALPANQIITGTDANMSSDMVSAFTAILQNGVQIALIK